MSAALDALAAAVRGHPMVAAATLTLLASLALALALSMLRARRLRGRIRAMERRGSKIDAHFWTARTIMAPCERCWGEYVRAQGGRDNADAWGLRP